MKIKIKYDYDPTANPARPYWANTRHINGEWIWKAGATWKEAKENVIEAVRARNSSPTPIPEPEEIEI